MGECFRFLINVDQCLNMSNFDIFFYKLASQKKYHLNEVRLFGDSAAMSLQGAIEDIRMYLNKYPYHVSDYQLIVAMRKQYQSDLTAWNQTLLYRLIQLYDELQKEHIFMSSKEQAEKVLNLIMLYEADFSSDLPKLDNYLTSARLMRDCGLLFQEMGIDHSKRMERQELATYLCQYQKRETSDHALCNFMSAFLKVFVGDALVPDAYADDELFAAEKADENNDGLLTDFISFVKEKLANYQVYEEMVDKNNRRGNILAQLRVVDFINMSVDEKEFQHEESGVIPLRDRCRKNWKIISEDTELEYRYAAMLHQYRIDLQNAEMDLEKPDISSPTSKPIPPKQIPSENEIHSSEGAFTSDDLQQQGYDFHEILEKFATNKFSPKSMRNEWEGVYQRVKCGLDKMDYDLQSYAEDLSSQYSALLEKRKKDTAAWDSPLYIADDSVQKAMSELDYERDARLKDLQSPHMSPSLKFQDQLNMENSLEQSNMDIQFYIGCMQKVTIGNMFLLLAVLIVLTIGHYTFLQPYVFQDSASLAEYLIYIAGIMILMLCTWRAPYRYFRNKLKKCIKKLQNDMDSYIRGYFEKAKHFKDYINDLNQLDYIHRYSRLQHRAYETKTKLSKGYLWHKSQVKVHLLKLKFFRELINAYSDQFREDEPAQTDLPTALGDQVEDVIDCPIYWPQK